MEWTTRQNQVIESRDKTILVSAAAGSGKTATLVERIFQKVVDPEHPVDITSFLVVTFTKAAAAQMKEKLMSKMEDALLEHPESEHIARQNVLIQSADITTIDSFCLRIVKDYFGFLNLDPSISIGDPGMMEMLKYDVMTELFEQKYEAVRHADTVTEFEMLLDLFGDGKKDDGLRDVLNKIYRQMASFPDPERFLQEAREALQIDKIEDIEHTAWMQDMFRIMHKKANAALKLCDACISICEEEEGPKHYQAKFESDAEKLHAIAEAETYMEMHAALERKWERFPGGRHAGDKELAKNCKDMRKIYKDDLDKVNCFKQNAEAILSDMKLLKSYLLPLLDLTEEFEQYYMEEKKKRKMLEFSDISHMAFKLVCAGYDENGCAVPTEIGRSIAARYSEIYIDEYQDSNYLQEDILTAVSGSYRGDHNMFMVGDVKQSIYRFRMARPEIFVKKYNRFTEDGDEIKIELNENFRSRAVVLQATNYFFYQLMGRDLGGINYDEKQALVPERKFPEADEHMKVAEDVELLIVDADDPGNLTEEMLETYQKPDKNRLEGLMIANRIRELMDPENGIYVFDDKTNEYRLAEYRDIVILSRSLKNYGEDIYNALTSQGIPVYLEKSQGYFQAVEIQVILSMLSVVDNSRQDIPLSAVLLSPIGRLDESELTEVCGYVRKHVKEPLCLYEQCEYYVLDQEKTEIGKKLKRVMGIIQQLKEEKQYLSVSDLIWEMLRLTGYYEYVTAMPAGEIRKTNVDMLLEKAVKFENGYYKGLFHFLRYVDKLKLIEGDEGEANVLNEDADVVRIMSIHKSKGLEFPIVFVAGMGRQFNRSEFKDNVLVHPDYYLAAMAMYSEDRYKHNTAIRSIYEALEDEEMMAENMRVLYVAMTRAKEKLILTAGVRNVTRLYDKFDYLYDFPERLLPYNVRKNADSYIAHLIACMIRYDRIAGQCGVAGRIRTVILNQEMVLSRITKQEIESRLQIADIHRMAEQAEEDAFYERNQESLSFQYKYEMLTKLATKLSISDIKKMKAYDGQGYDIATEFQPKEPVKRHRNQEENGQLTGAERGTIVHKFMELLPFEQFLHCSEQNDYKDCIENQKNELLRNEIMEAREIEAISVGKITKMLQSDLGCRMIKAASVEKLFKESQFSACIPVSEVYDTDQDDALVVQGIIDAYFYEEDEIVVMDYKTDVAEEETLIKRYKAQLASYAEILEQLTGHKVKEQIIYSFYLQKEIKL